MGGKGGDIESFKETIKCIFPFPGVSLLMCSDLRVGVIERCIPNDD